jgi:predicted porin
MKKLMMGTAIALLAGAGYASAQEWSVDVKGYNKSGFGYISIDDGNDDVGFIRDTEIHVNGELVADNGLTFGAKVEFETGDDDGNASVDENYLYVKGSFGRFEAGEADGAADWAKYAGDTGSPWGRSGDGVGALFDGAYYGDDIGNLLDSYSGDTSDDLKLSYYTPSFAGFSAGVSYVVSNNDNGRASTRGDDLDSWEFGVAYSGEFSGVSLDAGVGYTVFGDGVNNSDYGVGGSIAVGYAGFQLGVAYGSTENGTTGNDGVNDVFADNNTMMVGLSYATGPWTFGGDVAFHIDDVYVDKASTAEGSQLGVTLGAAYALAPGVSVGVSGEYLDADNGDDEAYAALTWIGLSF